MKAAPLLLQWHNDGNPIFSAHFEPQGKGRLATAGGDNNVRLWKIDSVGEDRKVTYLSTLTRHTGTVNVVRWMPKGEMLASAGDDGNILLWVPAEDQENGAFGEDNGLGDKEHWRVKHMFRNNGSEIYDLAWSPDGAFFITGSMDNVARIYNAQTGTLVRMIADHNHFVQGVAWDPLNEYVATQSSDRSVHIYTLKTKEGTFTLHNRIARMDYPAARRISSSSPAPPDFSSRASFLENSSHPISMGSPVPSAPSTPQTLALPMNPPPTSHSRRSSFGSSRSVRRSVSPAPSLPLPAVMPSNSPSLSGLGLRNDRIYAGEETFSSFFRRLTFAPDGSLLFTPAGQYRLSHDPATVSTPAEEIINTVYIYTRAGLNKPPVAYLPGHSRPSVAVKCSPIYYNLRQASIAVPTKHITVDTSSADSDLGVIPALPEPAIPTKAFSTSSAMDPPPFTSAPSPLSTTTAPSPKAPDSDVGPTSNLPAGLPLAFGLSYRMVYAVATSDAVYVYDTQQTKPLCICSNLHFATFTDLTWSNDGLTLFMSSSDGFCSCLTFSAGELGQIYQGTVPTRAHYPTATPISTTTPSQHTTPTVGTPVNGHPSPLKKESTASFLASPSTFAPVRPASPARSMSASSIASFVQHAAGDSSTMMNSIPTMSSIGSVAAAQSGPVLGNLPLWTPPETPLAGGGYSVAGSGHRTHSASSSVSGIGSFATRRESEVESSIEVGEAKKREAESVAEDQTRAKKRRVAPTVV